ncbi:hypothetical protein BC6307_10765 [Sutcliffiella cohnii]|uniref:Uncharacterized protein n=1 Tax=Sutcliffiella cohnii TaxID=33932 RepID=A0A223KQY1_9BACI|nr:hypothetical protein [Sutcliffiella cohnii]AST91723.1 hypothetical protein BC6307_10765 [Sutcliffiella cohnii]
MPDYLEIGSFHIPSKWVMIVVTLIISFLIIKRMTSNQQHSKVVLDDVSNSLIIGFIVWKFSYILLQFHYAFSYPISILYFDGGSKGILLAFFIFYLFLFYRSKKTLIPLSFYTQISFQLFLVGSIIFHFIHILNNPLYFSIQITFAFIIFLLVWKNKDERIGEIQRYLLVYSFGQFFLQFYSPLQPFLLGFTVVHFICASIILWSVFHQLEGGYYEKKHNHY